MKDKISIWLIIILNLIGIIFLINNKNERIDKQKEYDCKKTCNNIGELKSMIIKNKDNYRCMCMGKGTKIFKML